ncbi:MAG TPA: transcription antitermination factor NusB [Bryobacteraceae bacterium]|nr:transcription antitermination factor NusB [Bryobacteraceae bacterium]
MHVTGILMMGISPSRAAALQTLEAVQEGAYASDTLRAITEPLTPRDAGLASQIVFGCLRFQAQLDFLTEMYSGRKIRQLDAPVLLALRCAIFQLRYLERVPAHAAVHDAVEWVKRRARSAAGFVNAVLRKVNRDPVVWPDVATELCVPQWMLDRWTQHFGPEPARGIAEAALRKPAPYIRVPRGSVPPEGLELEPTSVAGAYRVLSEAPRKLRLHDISSQAIVPLLELEPGNSYLDLCAAPGNKTLQALETQLSLAIACDVSFARILQIPPVCDRVVLDATVRLPFTGAFDRIFVDAPCSGTGTLGRNPEIKWRVQPEDFPQFGEKQARIAGEGVRCLKPGGTLVYATCSLEIEENESVVRHILKAWPGLRCVREMWRLPGREQGDGFYAAVVKKF